MRPLPLADPAASSTMVMHGSQGGIGIIAVAYAMSCLGCLLGLSAMSRARSTGGAARARWIVLAACAIGGTGIWVMHFIAMLGFSVPGATITYNVPITIASLAVSIVVTGLGLTLTVLERASLRALALGGIVTGIGVAVMHYLGMAAVNMPESVTYNKTGVALSVVIAIVAATAALWAAVHIRGVPAMVGASLVMGVAISGMHYTGMASMIMHMAPYPHRSGLSAYQLLMPLTIGIGLSTIAMLMIVGLSATEHEIGEAAEVRAVLEEFAARSRQREAEGPGAGR